MTNEIDTLRAQIDKLTSELDALRAFVLPRELARFRGAPGQPPSAWPRDFDVEPQNVSPYERERLARARDLFRREAEKTEAAHQAWRDELERVRLATVRELLALQGDAETLDSLRAFGGGPELEAVIARVTLPPARASGAVLAVVEHVRRRGSGDALLASGGVESHGTLLVGLLTPAEAAEAMCIAQPRVPSGRLAVVLERGGEDPLLLPGFLEAPTLDREAIDAAAERAVMAYRERAV